MKSVLVIAAGFVSFALAYPGNLDSRQDNICPGTYSNAQCCAVNVLDLADLDCADPDTFPLDRASFITICAAEGQKAMCCLLPILGQALLCDEVTA